MRLILLIVVSLLFTVSSQAQTKKAIIIASDKQINYEVQDSVLIESCNLETSQNTWNKLYLIWENLYIEKEYSNEDIEIFYSYGSDFSFPSQDLRYNAVANHLFNITDQAANKQVVLDYLKKLNSEAVSEIDVEIYFISSHKALENFENDLASVTLHDKQILLKEEIIKALSSEFINIGEIQVINSYVEK
jgi:hypothetical protein